MKSYASIVNFELETSFTIEKDSTFYCKRHFLKIVRMKIFLLLTLLYFITSVAGYQKNPSLNNIHDTTSQKLKDKYSCNDNQSWCIPQDYQNDEEPWKFRHLSNSTLPFNYHFIFNILEIEEINDMTQEITIHYYLRVKWKETRLIVDQNHTEWKSSDRKGGALSYQSDILKTLWTPDLEISGLKKI